MKLLAWDEVSGTTVTALDLRQSVEDVARMGLRERMDYLERLWGQIEGGVDPVTDPVYWETPGGTWIKYGRFGIRQGMNSMIAANPRNDLQCVQDLKQAVDEFCDLPSGDEQAWLVARLGSQTAEVMEIEAAEVVAGTSTNFVASNVEDNGGHVIWAAYFRSEPSDDDFAAAYESIRLGEGPEMFPEVPEEVRNELSIKLGLRRFYMGQAV